MHRIRPSAAIVDRRSGEMGEADAVRSQLAALGITVDETELSIICAIRQMRQALKQALREASLSEVNAEKAADFGSEPR